MNTVIERFIRDATQDDYAGGVSAGRGPGERGPGRSAGSLLVLVAVGVVGLVTALAVISTRASDDGRQATRAELVSRVVALSERIDVEQAAVADQAQVVEALQSDLLDFDGDSVRSALMEDLAMMSGITEESGPGLVVTIDDAPDAKPGSLNRVLDRDIQEIVNELWRSGARGVAVNDQRLTSATAIRGAGEAILVNYHPLTRPYTISAVGPSGSAMTLGGLEQLLDDLGTDFGLVSGIEERDVVLPTGEVRPPGTATIPGAAE